MPYLDIYRLFFDGVATIEDEASVFGKEWRSTLDCVLNQPGLEAAYTSKPSVQDGLWVFLVWQTEKDREHFFYHTTGFGFMSGYMTNTPAVYLCGEDAYDGLDTTKTWVIDIVVAAKADVGGKEEKQELQLPQPMSRYSFVGQQERATVEKLYQGNHFGNAIVGLMKSDRLDEKFVQSKHTWARNILEFEKCGPGLCPDCRTTEVPANIADLIERQPWEYGLISYDTSIYSSLDYPSTAHPLSLTFQPMCTMDVPDEFLGEPEHHGDGELETDQYHIMCILSLPESIIGVSESGDEAIEKMRNKTGLQADTQGLREVRILRNTSIDHSQITQLICTWHSNDDFKQWKHAITSHNDVSLEYSWFSKRGDLSLLEWDNMPLTPDLQSWQKLDKILEVVEFAFEKGLSPTEKKAFEHRIYAFTSTMSSCWSEGVDERPVVYAEEPIWTLSEGTPSCCLLLVAWDGVEQREAWLRNFMANGFNWTGHLSHMLGSVCNLVESRTYTIEKLHVEHVPLDTLGGIGDRDDGSESDSDMGF